MNIHGTLQNLNLKIIITDYKNNNNIVCKPKH